MASPLPSGERRSGFTIEAAAERARIAVLQSDGNVQSGAHQEPGFGIVAENREQISELALEKQRLRHSRMETGIVESRRLSVQKTTCAKDFADDGQNRAY
jgi:hypothetical protein